MLARHVELRGFHTQVWAVRFPASDVTMRSVSADHFVIAGASEVSVFGGVLGPGQNATNLITTASTYGIKPSQGVLLDGVTFRSYHGTGGYSAPCLQVDGVTGLVVRESRFSDCDDGGLLFASRGPAGAPSDVTLENNVIVCCRSGADAVRLDDGNGELWSAFLVRNNSSIGAFTIAPESSTLSGLEFSSNVAESFTGCGRFGVSVDYNVWATGSPCGPDDAVAAAGFEDSAHGNLAPAAGLRRHRPKPCRDIRHLRLHEPCPPHRSGRRRRCVRVSLLRSRRRLLLRGRRWPREHGRLGKRAHGLHRRRDLDDLGPLWATLFVSTVSTTG